MTVDESSSDFRTSNSNKIVALLTVKINASVSNSVCADNEHFILELLVCCALQGKNSLIRLKRIRLSSFRYMGIILLMTVELRKSFVNHWIEIFMLINVRHVVIAKLRLEGSRDSLAIGRLRVHLELPSQELGHLKIRQAVLRNRLVRNILMFVEGTEFL
jgi:hypothetical protein